MRRHIARQAIFDCNLDVVGYELLYRDGDENAAHVTDGDKVTRNLLSDAMMVFGLNNLTDGKTAYVNFTEKLVLNGFVLLADPKQVTVELLETIRVSKELIYQLEELKARGYRLALDDYTGDPKYDPILPLIDVLKVDFTLTDEAVQAEIARKYRKSSMQLLAEKVEDGAVYQRAAKLGYQLFQGYFFEVPKQLRKEVPDINNMTYIRLLRELNKLDVDMEACAKMIRADATLTYRLLKKVNTLQYYRGNSVQVIRQAVAYLGIDELYHWVVLILARDFNCTYSLETVRQAYLRGIFTERLMARSPYNSKKTSGFLLGMFSLMDRILNTSFEELLDGIELPEEVTEILLGKSDAPIQDYLAFVVAYERDQACILPKLDIAPDAIVELYMKSIRDTDLAFRIVQ